MTLKREDILGADDLVTTEVPVPEWGGSVRIRTLTGAQRDQWDNAMFDIDKPERQKSIRALTAIFVVVDESDNPVFSLEDMAALKDKSGAALDRIWDKASKQNHLTPEDIGKLEKN